MHAFTGFQDAQAAWTMATSAGLGSGAFSRSVDPAAASTPPHLQVAAGYPTPASGSHSGALNPGATPMPVDDGAGKIIKLFARAAVALVRLRMGGATGLWWWTQRTPVALVPDTQGTTRAGAVTTPPVSPTNTTTAPTAPAEPAVVDAGRPATPPVEVPTAPP